MRQTSCLHEWMPCYFVRLTLTSKSAKVLSVVFDGTERGSVMSKLDEIRNRFKSDRFATEAVGIVIDSAEPGKAVCSLTLEPHHMNANHVPLGGAVFTLADFTCAVAANGFEERNTVSQNASITFLAPARGKRLIAEASCLRSGRTTALLSVDIRDELGTYVAHATVNAYVIK